MEDVMKIVKSLEESILLIKEIHEKIRNIIKKNLNLMAFIQAILNLK